MTWSYKSSIKRKVTAVIMLASVAVLLVTVVAFMVYDLVTFRQTMAQNLGTQARIIAENSTAALAFSNEDDAANVLASLRTDPHITAAAIYDAQGKLFAKYPPQVPDADLPGKPQNQSHQFGKSHLALFQPAIQSGRQTGTLYLQSDLIALSQRLQLYGVISLLIILGSMLVAFWLSNTLQTRISNPIIALAEIAGRISEQRDYSLRAPKSSGDKSSGDKSSGDKSSGDELGFLTDSFNSMIERIQTSDSALRQAKAELAEANEWLERRVRERTADLIQTNIILEDEIAARKKAEMVHAQLAAIVESSSDAILSKTQEGIVTSWNSGAERMFGYTAEEIAGRSIAILIPADRSDELAPFLDRILREETVEPFETVRVRKDGHLVYVSLTLSPVKDEAGRVTGVSAIMQDISERKRLEAEILQVSEREQRRIAEDLHDGVGQQLGGISCLSDVLKKNLVEQASPEAEAAAKISKLLNDAMAQTRSLARGLHPVTLEANGLMSALEDLAARITDLFKVSCDFECPEPVLVEDNTTATHLYRIAQEAVSNSVKHGKAQQIKIGLSSTPEQIILAVNDNGVGFQQGERHSKSLGLLTMSHRCGMIGGKFIMHKNAGGGTAVVCTVQKNKNNGHTPKINNGQISGKKNLHS